MKNEEKILYASFPKNLKEEVFEVIKIIDFNSGYGHLSPDQFDININYEIIKIPARVYLDEPNVVNQTFLSSTQKEILSCIYSRHHDGYIREKHLKKIILSKNIWVIPFIFQLVGEYVIEILDVIYSNLITLDKNDYKEFVSENPIFYEKTKQRVRSYWDCYYRCKYPNINDYVGHKIIKQFEII